MESHLTMVIEPEKWQRMLWLRYFALWGSHHNSEVVENRKIDVNGKLLEVQYCISFVDSRVNK